MKKPEDFFPTQAEIVGSSPINDFIFSMSQSFAQSLDELGEFFCKMMYLTLKVEMEE